MRTREHVSGLFGSQSYLSSAPSDTDHQRRSAAVQSDGWKWHFFSRNPTVATTPTTRDGATRRTAKMARVEAVLLVADEPISPRRLVQLATLADAREARELIGRLNAAYDAAGCAFRAERIATGYRLLTRPEFAFWLDKLHQRQTALKLSPPAMETLTIVAYRQPISRADIEAVRGVKSAEMLKQLMDRGLVRIAGEDDSLGRPYLYQTTREFLERFGLQDLNDLPMTERLRQPKTADGPVALPQDAVADSAKQV